MLAALLVVARERIAAELSVASGIPMRIVDSDTGVICDTPNAYRSSSRDRAYHQGISKLLFRTSCI
jgi:hypothetical protein